MIQFFGFCEFPTHFLNDQFAVWASADLLCNDPTANQVSAPLRAELTVLATVIARVAFPQVAAWPPVRGESVPLL